MLTTVEPIAPRRSDWFASWFDSSHYHKLYAHRDETEAVRFLDELMSRLRCSGCLKPRASTLDAAPDDIRGT